VSIAREVFHLETPAGGRFAVLTRPQGAVCGALLYLAPFAEEMNKSRRMAALAARRFAEQGWMVLQVDGFGCGDSAGEFGEASWQHWLDDLDFSYRWLETRSGHVPRLWSLRASALLAADWLAASGTATPWLMWQPVVNGKQHLTQFLRLAAAGEMLEEQEARGVLNRLRGELAAGRSVEVAGYRLAPALCAGLEAATLRLPPGWQAPVALLEVSSAADAGLSPAVARVQEAWRASGVAVDGAVVAGSAFWTTQEIETVPGLIEQSLRMIERFHA
jgi:exosortase A-associated hydrolase 2